MKNEILEKRNWSKKYWIKYKLKEAVKDAKKGNKTCALTELYELRGMLLYMNSIGDITEKEDEQIYKLTKLIINKYKLY